MSKIKIYFTLFLSSGLGAGYLPFVPGTWGSAVIMVAGWWLLNLSIIWYLVIAAAIFLLGILIVPSADHYWRPILGRDWDNRPIVIDEWIGMLITYLPLFYYGKTWQNLLIGFLLFRFFDVLKFGLASWADKIKNQWGVILDDFFAGIHSALALLIILWLVERFSK